MNRSIGSVLLCLVLAALPAVARADAGITVDVESLRSDLGSVRLALFPSEHGWTQTGYEVATCRAVIRNHRAACTFVDVPPGTYALAFLHDEDDDGALDRDFIGLPREGFGFSNDAPSSFGPPSFDAASFAHDGSPTELVVHARYGL